MNNNTVCKEINEINNDVKNKTEFNKNQSSFYQRTDANARDYKGKYCGSQKLRITQSKINLHHYF